MLTLDIESNRKEELDIKYALSRGIRVYLKEDGETTGVARLVYDDGFCLTDFFIEKNDCEYNRQFFFRGIVFKLGNADATLKIKTSSEVLIPYGFRKDGEYMIINCKDANYPSACNHK